jgi:GDP-L-fucose synthase
MAAARPHALFLAAATVGGINANDQFPADFLYDNLAIAANVIAAAHKVKIEKLLYLGSSCIYPRLAQQPMQESALLTGALEPTNEWYAIAKIAGLKLCQAYRRQSGDDFISAMPTNLYGINDNFHPLHGHVLPALMGKAHAAKMQGSRQLSIWGSGRPRREFLYVDDLSDALVFLMEHYSGESHVNIGTGTDVSIKEAAESVANVVGFHGELAFDASKPDGAPRKLLDVSRLHDLGWQATTTLEDGLRRTYAWFLSEDRLRGLNPASVA